MVAAALLVVVVVVNVGCGDGGWAGDGRWCFGGRDFQFWRERKIAEMRKGR